MVYEGDSFYLQVKSRFVKHHRTFFNGKTEMVNIGTISIDTCFYLMLS